MNEHIIAIIPARYQSSRFAGKPLALIAGKPMIQHVVERAWRSSLLSRVVVATDDARIAQVVRDFGAECILTAASHATGTDRLAEAAALLGLGESAIIVNIQGDQPLFAPEIIDQLTQPLLADPSLSMSTLIYRIIRPEEITDPNHVKTTFDHRGRALYFSRASIPFQRDAAGISPSYYKHLGFYAYRKAFLDVFVSLPEGQWERAEKLEQLRALEYGYAIGVACTEHDSIEVDTPEDALRVESLLKHQGRTQA